MLLASLDSYSQLQSMLQSIERMRDIFQARETHMTCLLVKREQEEIGEVAQLAMHS